MRTPKLQFALDIISIDEALQIAEFLRPYWDILEIGTALLLQEGLRSVAVIRERFPEAVIMADTKIIDGGALLSEAACEAGADIISVVSFAAERTIKLCIEVTHKYEKRVLLDHLSVDWISADLMKKSAYGADIIGLHIPTDVQGTSQINKNAILAIKGQTDAAISIAGGVNPHMVQNLNGYPVDTFVAGGYLLKAKNAKTNAIKLNSALNR